MNSDIHTDQNSRTTTSRFSLFGEPLRDTWLSIVVIGFMMVTMVALFRFPVHRIFANVEVNYNEGWNAYRADMVAKGIRLYGELPQGWGTYKAYASYSFNVMYR